MSHACGGILNQRVSSILPMGIYTIEVSSVGDTEEMLKEQGRPYVVGRASLEGNAREPHRRGGRVRKLIADAENGRILGVHRPTRLRARPHRRGGDGHQGDLQYFIEAVFNYPTLGEVYKYAAYDALDQMRERREGNVWPFTRPAARSQVP